jgi:carotenoid cleavage dioxygenase-like enzyme
MAAFTHCQLAGAKLAPVRSLKARRGVCTAARAVQTPAKPSESTTRETVKSTPLDAFPKSAVQSRQTPKPATETFDKAYKDYSTGYASVPGLSYERSEWIEEVIGEIPKEIEGTLLRNGPAMYVRGEGADRFEKSYLDGDGMVTSIAIKDGKAYFRNKFVRTEHFDKEEALGKYTEPSIFTAADPRKPAFFWRLFNDILAGNLSRKQNGAYNVLNWGGNLVAVDYKKPYELDPDTLDTVGHGASPLSSVMHTSHYRTVDEPDGSGRRCVAFLNEVDWRSETTGAVFYEFDEDGVEVSRRAYDYPASYVHDLVVTDNYYILFDCPIKIDFPAVFTKYIFEKSCLSELICEDTDRRPLFRIFPRRGESREVKTVEADYWCYAYHHVNGFERRTARSSSTRAPGTSSRCTSRTSARPTAKTTSPA